MEIYECSCIQCKPEAIGKEGHYVCQTFLEGAGNLCGLGREVCGRVVKYGGKVTERVMTWVIRITPSPQSAGLHPLTFFTFNYTPPQCLRGDL